MLPLRRVQPSQNNNRIARVKLMSSVKMRLRPPKMINRALKRSKLLCEVLSDVTA